MYICIYIYIIWPVRMLAAVCACEVLKMEPVVWTLNVGPGYRCYSAWVPTGEDWHGRSSREFRIVTLNDRRWWMWLGSAQAYPPRRLAFSLFRLPS